MSRMPGVALGLVLLAAPVASAQNLVQNPGFETGDFTGWTQWGNTDFSGVDDFNPRSGNYAAYFGNFSGLGGIFQGIATSPDVGYTFSFWLSSDGGAPNYFDVYWNSTALQVLIDVAPFAYTMYSFQVLGTGFDRIDFGFLHSPGYWDLDDVRLVANQQQVVPEPVSIILLGTGLLGVAAVRRRRSSSDA